MKVRELQAYLGDMLTVNPVFDGSTGVLNYQVAHGVIFSTLLQIFITQFNYIAKLNTCIYMNILQYSVSLNL